jgi:hypothetical protein
MHGKVGSRYHRAIFVTITITGLRPKTSGNKNKNKGNEKRARLNTAQQPSENHS